MIEIEMFVFNDFHILFSLTQYNNGVEFRMFGLYTFHGKPFKCLCIVEYIINVVMYVINNIIYAYYLQVFFFFVIIIII